MKFTHTIGGSSSDNKKDANRKGKLAFNSMAADSRSINSRGNMYSRGNLESRGNLYSRGDGGLSGTRTNSEAKFSRENSAVKGRKKSLDEVSQLDNDESTMNSDGDNYSINSNDDYSVTSGINTADNSIDRSKRAKETLRKFGHKATNRTRESKRQEDKKNLKDSKSAKVCGDVLLSRIVEVKKMNDSGIDGKQTITYSIFVLPFIL